MASTCRICCEEITHRVWTPCGHSEVCGVCVLRMRALLHQSQCSFCRVPLDPVAVVAPSRVPLTSSSVSTLPFDEPSGMHFQRTADLALFRRMRSLYCILCPRTESRRFHSYTELDSHISSSHRGRRLCLVCCDHDQGLFVHERVVYPTKEALAEHVKKGTPEARDNVGVPAHRSCRVCKAVLYDEEALQSHMQAKHYRCHICQSRHGSTTYYARIGQLESHFRAKHYLCEAPHCLAAQFVVFDNRLDLQAHTLATHSGAGLSQKERRRRAKVELDYTAPAVPVQHDESKEESPVNPEDEVHFPSLGGGATPTPTRTWMRGRAPAPREEDFPSLPSRGPAPRPPKPKAPAKPDFGNVVVKVRASKKTRAKTRKARAQQVAPAPIPYLAEHRRVRNAEFMTRLRGVMGTQVEYLEPKFRSMSQAYYSGAMPASEYYLEFLCVCGSASMDTIHSLLLEVVRLLPDPALRQALYQAYVQAMKQHEELSRYGE